MEKNLLSMNFLLKSECSVFPHPSLYLMGLGLNENTNGLIRQYFPKNTQFNQISDQQVQSVLHILNNRHRKCLCMKTSNQVFLGEHPIDALIS